MRAQLADMWFAGYLIDQGGDIEMSSSRPATQMPHAGANKVRRYSPELAATIDRYTLIFHNRLEERAMVNVLSQNGWPVVRYRTI